MKQLGTKVLSSPRLILRPFQASDAEAMYHNWAKDDDVTKYLTWESHSSQEVTEDIINIWLENYSNGLIFLWAITLLEKPDEPIGSISIGEVSEGKRSATVGYALAKEYWNQGYMTEALQRVIEFMMKEVGLNRLTGRHCEENVASGLVMQKAGMTYEGSMREAHLNSKGDLVNMVQYAIIAADLKD